MSDFQYPEATGPCPRCKQPVLHALLATDGSKILLEPVRRPHEMDEVGFNIDGCCADHEPVARELRGLNLFDPHACPQAPAK